MRWEWARSASSAGGGEEIGAPRGEEGWVALLDSSTCDLLPWGIILLRRAKEGFLVPLIRAC